MKTRQFVKMFQPRFAPLVETGIKRQTVRPLPKRMPAVGDGISLREWTGKPYRSPQRELRKSVITRVEFIRITAEKVNLWEDDIYFQTALWNLTQLNLFAVADGFTDWADLAGWFEGTHGLPFEGVLICWE